MSQTQTRPVVPPKPRANWRVIILVFALLAVLFAFGSLYDFFRGDAGNPAPAGEPSSAAANAVQPVVDQAELAKYWADTCKTIDGCDLVTEPPRWDGSWLVVQTDLFPDSDAKAPAVVLCGALSGYWAASGRPFQAVRVLDKAGNVLVSRRSEGETCTWRR